MSRPRLVCVSLALVTLLVYWPVRLYAFASCDDGLYVTENPVVQAGLTWAGVKWALTSLAYVSDWHPLVWFLLILDRQLFGLNAGWLHLVDVSFHAVNAILLFLLLLCLTSALRQSAFIAALFAWHPLRMESVIWVTECQNVLFVFFGLLPLLACVRYAQIAVKSRGSEAKYEACDFCAQCPGAGTRLCFGVAVLCAGIDVQAAVGDVAIPRPQTDKCPRGFARALKPIDTGQITREPV
jgi:hypothetical protein